MAFVSWRAHKRPPPVRYNWGGETKQRYPCRCKCGRRITLAKAPDEYVRSPRCKRCKQRGTMRIDRHRMKREWHVRPCNCYGYSFPHHKGRGYCDHNPKLTAEDLRLRHESGRYS